MIADDLRRELLDEIENLPENEQRQVLHYARSIRKDRQQGVFAPIGHLFGAWDAETADEVEAAIEEGCEQINEEA